MLACCSRVCCYSCCVIIVLDVWFCCHFCVFRKLGRSVVNLCEQQDRKAQNLNSLFCQISRFVFCCSCLVLWSLLLFSGTSMSTASVTARNREWGIQITSPCVTAVYESVFQKDRGIASAFNPSLLDGSSATGPLSSDCTYNSCGICSYQNLQHDCQTPETMCSSITSNQGGTVDPSATQSPTSSTTHTPTLPPSQTPTPTTPTNEPSDSPLSTQSPATQPPTTPLPASLPPATQSPATPVPNPGTNQPTPFGSSPSSPPTMFVPLPPGSAVAAPPFETATTFPPSTTTGSGLDGGARTNQRTVAGDGNGSSSSISIAAVYVGVAAGVGQCGRAILVEPSPPRLRHACWLTSPSHIIAIACAYALYCASLFRWYHPDRHYNLVLLSQIKVRVICNQSSQDTSSRRWHKLQLPK